MGVADKTPWEKDIQVAEKDGQVTLWKPVCMKYTCYQTLGPVPSPTGSHDPTHFHKVLEQFDADESDVMKNYEMLHTQKDCLEDEYRTAVRMVEDMFTDTTEPHLKAVNTLEAEVRKVQSKEFAPFGGKYEVQKG